MSKHAWAWAAGTAIFALVAGLWLWQLPNIISRANGGKDADLGSIFSSFAAAKESMAPEFVGLQEQVDRNIAQIGQAVTETAVQAQALDEVKKKIETEAVKDKIEAALIKNQEPVSVDQ